MIEVRVGDEVLIDGCWLPVIDVKRGEVYVEDAEAGEAFFVDEEMLTAADVR